MGGASERWRGPGGSGAFVASKDGFGPGRVTRLLVTFVVLLLVVIGLPPLPFAIGEPSPVQVTMVTASVGPTAPGETISYTAFVQNEGAEALTGVVVSAPVPDGTSLVEGSTEVLYAPAVVAVVADDFESGTLDGSSGLNPWDSPWVTDGDLSKAHVITDEEAGSSVLAVGAPATDVTRTVDLSGFPAAYLTYRYKRIELPEDATFAVELARAGEESFAPVDQLAGAGSGFTEPTYQTQTIDISRFISGATQLRFGVDGADVPEGAGFRIDQVTITSIPPGGTTAGHPEVASGFTLLPGDELSVSYSVVVNGELGEQTEFVAQVAVVSDEDPNPRRAEAVTDLNRPPAAADDMAETAVEQLVVIDVLANDTDPNNEPLAVVEVGKPTNGTVAINEDQTITYQPAEGFQGEDGFKYEVSDALGETDAAIVTVTLVEAALPETSATTTTTSTTLPERTDVPLEPGKLTLPMTFEANAGQTDGSVDFVARGKGYQVFLTKGDAVLALGNGNSGFAIRMDLIDDTDNPQLVLVDRQPGPVNYFIGNDPAGWRTNVANYSAVEYRDVYPGVDLRYYGNDRQLEYDFIIQPHADPNQIALTFDGATSLAITDAGNLEIGLNPGRTVTFSAPISYQEIDGQRVTVASSYVLDGSKVSFNIGGYDPTYPLIIDPTLEYSSYLGGSSIDSADALAIDGGGNVITVGYSQSADYPVTVGAYDITPNGSTDVVVTSFDSTGTTINWASYLGGSAADSGLAVAVDGSNAVYVASQTQSGDFPTSPGAYDTSLTGSADVAVSKLTSNGSTLAYSTYLGGSGNNDYARSIAIDGSGNAVVAASTDSSNWPTTAGAFDTSFNGGYDAYVTKVNATGTGLVWSTVIGGGGNDTIEGMAMDGAGTVYLTGQAAPGHPTTAGAYDTSHNGDFDLWAGKLSTDGSALLYSTFVGSTGTERGSDIGFSDSNTLFVTGYTNHSGFPTTVGAYDTTKSSSDDIVALLLDLV